MPVHRHIVRLLVVLSLVAVSASSNLPAAEQQSTETVRRAAGILMDKKPGSLTIKVDGDAEASKYEVVMTDGKLVEELKEVFDACRVQISFRQEGDSRKLLGIKRQVTKATGTFTGDVVKVHSDFWIEVKPKTGLADAFAPGAETWNDKKFMQQLKELQPGESVTISYTTDFERHRIKTLRKNPRTPAPTSPTKPSSANEKSSLPAAPPK